MKKAHTRKDMDYKSTKKETSGFVPIISLRWNYPNQVLQVEVDDFLSARFTSSLLFIVTVGTVMIFMYLS